MQVRYVLGAAFVSASLAFAPLATAQTPEQSAKAQAVIDSQISAFKARNHDKAFSHAAPNLQQVFGSSERFITMVKRGYGALYGATNWSFGRSKVEAGLLYQEVLFTGPLGKEWVALYALKQASDKSWRIHGVQMLEGKAQAT